MIHFYIFFNSGKILEVFGCLALKWSVIKYDFLLASNCIVSVNWHCSEASLNSDEYCQAWFSCFCMQIFICFVVFLLTLSVLRDIQYSLLLVTKHYNKFSLLCFPHVKKQAFEITGACWRVYINIFSQMAIWNLILRHLLTHYTFTLLQSLITTWQMHEHVM
jgi:hypothetical protein